MLFNSVDFAVFLPVVFLLYWFVVNRNLRIQNLFLVVASYVFYGFWDWRFLSLLLFSTITDYIIGLCLKNENREKRRKLLLVVSMVTNLGFLGFFKYYNFFVEQFVDAFSFFGYHLHPATLHIILPVGISFYTFQTMSYTIDIYKRKLEPTKDFIAFAAFVSFFPQLVAGPIERATNLLPQFYVKRKFEYAKATDGLRQMLWGLFKKVAVADNCAQFVDAIFDGYETLPGYMLILGAFLFSIQIYCDFSGYSDIAIGCARLFGFNLMRNFAFPYFSRDIAEFWRRWHISLSTWFRDYVYIPLGGSRGSKWIVVRNTFIVYLLSGFWHGANWTFIFWGLINALYFLPLLLSGKNRKHLNIVAYESSFPSFKEFFQMVLTFTLVMFAWIFFRAESLGQAFLYVCRIFTDFTSGYTAALGFNKIAIVSTIVFIFVLIVVEWMQRRNQFGLQMVPRNAFLRYSLYMILLMAIFVLGGNQQSFIYFQF